MNKLLMCLISVQMDGDSTVGSAAYQRGLGTSSCDSPKSRVEDSKLADKSSPRASAAALRAEDSSSFFLAFLLHHAPHAQLQPVGRL